MDTHTVDWADRTVSVGLAILAEPLMKKINHYGSEVVRDIQPMLKKDGTGYIKYKVRKRSAAAVKEGIGSFVYGFLSCFTIMGSNHSKE